MGKRGPKTDAGRALAAQNARKHGILSRAVVVPGIETVEDWEEHRAKTVRSLAPATHLEEVLAERIAVFLWRLARVARYEGEATAMAQEKVEEDLAESRQFDLRPGQTGRPDEARGKLARCREEARLFRRFSKLPDTARLPGEDADTILWAVASAASVDLETFSLPGVGKDVALEEIANWTAGSVRQCIQAIALAKSEDPAELLEVAQGNAGYELRKAAAEVERVERDLDRSRRDRLLPSETTLDKVARYEAHLSRELSRALRELQEIQDRRRALEPEAATPAAERFIRGIAEGLVGSLPAADCPALPAGPAALPEGQFCETNSLPADAEERQAAAFYRNH